MFEQWNFIIFGRQKLTTLKSRLLRPNFDTIIKEKKSTYNGNNFCHFTEKVNNSALITVLNHRKSHRKCWCCGTPVFAMVFCVMRVLLESVVCRRVWRYQRDNHRNGKHTSMADYCLSFFVCPFGVCHSINGFWLPFRIFKLFLLYIKR